ncbi:MAG TPA: hypothetical protein VGX23_21120 [Actinocrinis sp.]|nr:hypothetical protein [Actinocrinis sp.]
MRAGRPTGCGIRLRVYGVRLATVPSDQGYQLVTDEEGHLVPTGEQYRIPKAPAALFARSPGCRIPGCGCADPGHEPAASSSAEQTGADRLG